jgi:hypothetical protein
MPPSGTGPWHGCPCQSSTTRAPTGRRRISRGRRCWKG